MRVKLKQALGFIFILLCLLLLSCLKVKRCCIPKTNSAVQYIVLTFYIISRCLLANLAYMVSLRNVSVDWENHLKDCNRWINHGLVSVLNGKMMLEKEVWKVKA